MTTPTALRCEDWRDADEATLGPLYRAECDRWRTALAWDFAPSCAIIEPARREGRLPGVLARRDDDSVAGWTFFVPHDGLLQVGGLVGDTDATCDALLRAACRCAEASRVRGITCYLFPPLPGIQHVLETLQFSVEPHRYLVLDLAPRGLEVAGSRAHASSWTQAQEMVSGSDLRARAFGDANADEIVQLMVRAYAGMPEAACFAPDGRPNQWAHYLLQLLQTRACGRYIPDASIALVDASGALAAALIMTAIDEQTAHLAQVVVDPSWRGRSLARDLFGWSRQVLARRGFRRLTLLVAEGNGTARRLYERLGFADRAVFLHGRRVPLG
jgi:ribosomal protein S18 acetylase RimI-like enzyme